MFKTETTRTDVNSDGNTDETLVVVSEIVDGRVISKVETSSNTLEPHSSISSEFYTYDELGRIIHEEKISDVFGTGSTDITSTIDRTFDEDGKVLTELNSRKEGYYTNLTTNEYSEFGLITEKLTTFSVDGVTQPDDFTLEQWSYKDDGQKLASYLIEDPFSLDNVITDYYYYNAKGQLGTIKQSNEYRFGDDRARTTDSFTWNADGTPKTETHWAGHDNPWGKYAFRTDYEFTSADKIGYDKTVIARDLTGDWDPEARCQIEEWRNEAGQITHTLTSFDNNGDGGMLAGGWDTRDLTVATWLGNEKVAEYTDVGLDGIVESSFTSVISEALLS